MRIEVCPPQEPLLERGGRYGCLWLAVALTLTESAFGLRSFTLPESVHDANGEWTRTEVSWPAAH